MEKEEIKKAVREGYANIARQAPTQSGCCGPSASPCCGTSNSAQNISKAIGYSEDEISAVPEGSNLGLGCGNPTALASINEGETVVDLGSGAGFDCFLAAKKVGETGKVIGVDMTPDMIDRARENARKDKYENIEFRLGEIENLPVADNTADLIISNCVINLSPDKARVFQEAFRVLKPGGRIMISDIMLLKELPEAIKNSIDAYIGCVSGAIKKEVYLGIIQEAGFKDVEIIQETTFPIDLLLNDPTGSAIIDKLNLTPEKLGDLTNLGASIKVRGIKPEILKM